MRYNSEQVDMDHIKEEGQYNKQLAPSQDGAAEVGSDNDHSLHDSSLVASPGTEEPLGENSDSNANKITDPGPPCEKDVEDTFDQYEKNFNNVCDKDKTVQPVKGSTFQNESCKDEKDGESSGNGSVIDLVNCPELDLSELCVEQCDWPDFISERDLLPGQGSEHLEQESFNDIHSLQPNSDWNENVISHDHEINSLHLSSRISHTSEIENHAHESATSIHSFNLIPLPCDSGGGELDLQSLEQNNMLLNPIITDDEPFLSQTSPCEDSLLTSDFSVSDAVQNESEIDISHHERIKGILHEEMFDSGFLKSREQDVSDDLSIYVYNSSLLQSSLISPIPLPEMKRLIINNRHKSHNEKVTYDFNEDKNPLNTFLDSQREFKDSVDRGSTDLVTIKRESFDDRNTSSFEDHDTSDGHNTSDNYTYSYDCSTSQKNLSDDNSKLSQGNCDTVSNISFSNSRFHHILFYIIHRTSSQKTIITFHDLEVTQEPQGRRNLSTLRSVSCNFHRGRWLLHHLKRLGLFTFHTIAPMVVIVEPALDGLGRYFQQMEQGQPVTVLESMQYEWMRVRSFWSFPRNAGMSYLYLARIGFFYTGRVSETCCFSCGKIYREWREGDDPLEIHRRISPACPHLNEGDARNMPIYPDVVNQWPAIPWEPLVEEAAAPPVEEPADLPEAEASDRDTEHSDTRSQLPSQETNIAVHTSPDHTSLGDDASSSIGEHRGSTGGEDLSQVLPRLASLNSTPHPIAQAEAPSAAGDQTEAGSPSLSSSSEGTSSRQTGGSDRDPVDRPSLDPLQRPGPDVQEQQQQEPRVQDQPPPNNNPQGQAWGRIIFPNPPVNSAPSAAPRPDDEQVPRGVPRADPQANYMPRYPDYVVQANRSDTFLHGWPAYLNQTPYEMSSAGFFYTGNGDYCRCFYCGGGLRNWEPGDDPWVEHARWFPRCLYVRQNKGERFVRLVQQRQENTRQNAPPRQEPVLQPPPANQPPPPPVERNRLQGQASQPRNQQGHPAGDQTSTPTTSGQQSQQGATTRQNAENTESTVNEMSLSAVESLKANGVSSSRIKEALQIWKRQQKRVYKMSDVTSAQLLQIIFDQEDEEARRLAETNQLASSLTNRSLMAVRGDTSDGAGAHFAGITPGDSTSDDPEVTEKMSLYNEIEEKKKQLMCSVCGENEVTVAFLPCGHLVCCFQCAPAMIKCPNCGEAVKGNVKVFLM